MKEIITGIIIFSLILLAVVLLKGPIEPDLSEDGGYESSRGSGHPLWNN